VERRTSVASKYYGWILAANTLHVDCSFDRFKFDLSKEPLVLTRSFSASLTRWGSFENVVSKTHRRHTRHQLKMFLHKKTYLCFCHLVELELAAHCSVAFKFGNWVDFCFNTSVVNVDILSLNVSIVNTNLCSLFPQPMLCKTCFSVFSKTGRDKQKKETRFWISTSTSKRNT